MIDMADLGLRIETEVEDDGRWIAEVLDMPGVIAYGATEKEAVDGVRLLASQVTKVKDQARDDGDFAT